MAKQRPSVHKRQREHQKRQREIKKAEKAALKRERRLNRDQPDSEAQPGDALGSDAQPEDADLAPGADSENAGPVE